MRIFPGDTFSNSRIEATIRDIFQTGFFEDIQPDIRPVANGDVDMVLKLKEKQTGQFMFGMAYSAETSASGFIQVAETNFRGKGQNIGVTWQFGSRQRYVDLSFTEPWFMGTPTLIGFDLFDRFQYNYDDFYESRIRGFSVRLGRRIPGTRYSNVGLRYELSETKLDNFSLAYTRYLDDLEASLPAGSDLPWQRLDQVDWPQTKSSIRLSLNRNSTDSPFFPTAGSKTSYSVEFAGGPLGRPDRVPGAHALPLVLPEAAGQLRAARARLLRADRRPRQPGRRPGLGAIPARRQPDLPAAWLPGPGGGAGRQPELHRRALLHASTTPRSCIP